MNNQEALRIIKTMRQDWDVKSNCPNAHALDVAIEALKNQIEKYVEQDIGQNEYQE